VFCDFKKRLVFFRQTGGQKQIELDNELAQRKAIRSTCSNCSIYHSLTRQFFIIQRDIHTKAGIPEDNAAFLASFGEASKNGS